MHISKVIVMLCVILEKSQRQGIGNMYSMIITLDWEIGIVQSADVLSLNVLIRMKKVVFLCISIARIVEQGWLNQRKGANDMEKFKDRKEQREVTEVMNALLLPMLNYLNADTVIKVRRALYLLGEIEVESQESEES